jgi:predicted negative regulator of RcsB-dependent stress response
LAQLLENENRFADVEEILQEAIAAGELNAHQNLATFFIRHARFREAEAVLRNGLNIGETYILHHLVSLLVMEGRLDEARREIGKYKEKGLYDACSLEASIFLAEGREGEARQALENAVRSNEWMADEKLLDLAFEEGEASNLDSDPALISPYAVQKLIEAGDTSKAKKVLNGLLADKSPWKAAEHADLLVRLGDESSAEALLRWAIHRRGWHPRTDLATHLRKRGRLEEAYKAARQAVILQEYGALIELSAVQVARNEYESAIAVLWEATARGERFAASRLRYLLNNA